MSPYFLAQVDCDIISTDMSNAFIQFDKPFYFAGDTIEGHVFLYIVEPVNAREITIKFKGWESARWIEERVLLEHERQNIQNNLIWHNVPLPSPRTIEFTWKAQTPKKGRAMMSP